jgi:hypothetical protein
MHSATVTVDTIGAPAARWGWRLMPCLTDIAFLLPAGLLFFKLGGTKTLFADGDTGWHIKTGEWILQHGKVPTQDLFSYTKPGQAWFAWEWAWDVLFALIHNACGLAGVGFATVLLLGTIAVLLYRLVVNACGNEVLSFFVTAFALCGSSIHWLARPHLFSWLFFLIFLHLLPAVQRGSRLALVSLPVSMLIWVNMHGAFLIGIALLLANACGEYFEALFYEGASLRAAYLRSRRLLLATGLCLASTFVNPYTWHLHQHVFRFLSDTKLLDNIQEYQSISFHCAPAIFFELMMMFAAGAAFWYLQTGKITPALVALLWTHLALLSARNIPLFMIVAAPMAGAWLQDVLKRLQRMRFIGGVFSTICEICEELKPMERLPRAYLLSGFSVLLMAILFAGGAKGFEAQFNPESFPIQVIGLVERSPAQRIFTYDQWADYLIYRLYPKKPVFMDGRSDFFGISMVTATQHILAAQFDWKIQLQRFGVDMILVRPDAPVSEVLKMSPDWLLRFDDGKVLVFEAASVKKTISILHDPRFRAISELPRKDTTHLNDSVLERRTQYD